MAAHLQAEVRSTETLLASLAKKLDSEREPLITVTADAHYLIDAPTA